MENPGARNAETQTRPERLRQKMNEKVSIAHTLKHLGTPASYGLREIGIIKGMLNRCMEDLGGIGSIVGQNARIVIRVNAGFDGPPGVYTTDPRVLEALIVLLTEHCSPREIIVAENAANQHMLEEIKIGTNTMACFRACGLADVAKRHGTRLLALEDDVHELVTIPKPRVMSHCLVPVTVLKADAILFVPHLKTHVACGITLNVKLNQGTIPTAEKKKYHDARLPDKLLDLLQIIRPKLCVVDGLWAIQGQGPSSPFTEDILTDVNVLATGFDPLYVDTAGAMLMGFSPRDIPVLDRAMREGRLDYNPDRLKLVGTPLEKCARAFRAPEMNLKTIHPRIRVYQGDACLGCISHLRLYLDQLSSVGILDDLRENLSIIVGRDCREPFLEDGPVLVVGDCASEHAGRGRFVAGCCPLSHIFEGLLDQISLCCDLKKFEDCEPEFPLNRPDRKIEGNR